MALRNHRAALPCAWRGCVLAIHDAHVFIVLLNEFHGFVKIVSLENMRLTAFCLQLYINFYRLKECSNHCRYDTASLST